MDNNLTLLLESYENSPITRGLIQLLPYAGVFDTALAVKLNNMRVKRQRIFFDKLRSGEQELSENIIESDDFLHAFFCTMEYSTRTSQDDKIKRFASLLLSVGKDEISFGDFEDYTSVVNDLSDREFAILALMYKYEQRFLPEKGEKQFTSNGQPLNPKQVVNLYWQDFKSEVISSLGVNEQEFASHMVRLQRTGCYLILTGYFDSGNSTEGNTTSLFQKIVSIVETHI